MKKLILLIALTLFSCDTDKDYCYRTVKYQKPNGDYIITVNVKVKCGTCEPTVERKDATFIECID
jgi:hypothetical protein